MTVRLADDCVRPGGSQTITVDSKPEVPVAYSSEYSDGKTGMEEGFYGGANAGKTDDKGTYTSTWTIAPNAPPGVVKVSVYGNRPDHELTERTVTFEMADRITGRCS